MKKFYAVVTKFSNVETVWEFDAAKLRDQYVAQTEKARSISATELKTLLAHNRRIVRENRKADSGWFNGLPTSMDDVGRMCRDECGWIAG